MLIEPMAAILLVWALLGQSPALTDVLGGALVVVCVIALVALPLARLNGIRPGRSDVALPSP